MFADASPISAAPWVLQTLRDDPFEFGWDIGIQSDWRNGCPVQDGLEYQPCASPSEGQRAGRHLIQHSTKRKQVSAGIQFLGADLFGRHIGDGSDCCPRTG